MTSILITLGITALVLYIGARYVITNPQRRRVFILVTVIIAALVVLWQLFGHRF